MEKRIKPRQSASTRASYNAAVPLKKDSLFGILSRSPWWVSLLIAAALFGALRSFFATLTAVAAAFPFLCLAVYVAWRQARTPSESRSAKLLDELRAASWEDFSARLFEAFRRDGYEVAHGSGAADFELKKNGRVTLAGCRRWKVAQTGAGPLRELVQAREKREADECLYVSAGAFTPQAQAFAAQHRVRLLSGAELAQLVRRVPVRAKP